MYHSTITQDFLVWSLHGLTLLFTWLALSQQNFLEIQIYFGNILVASDCLYESKPLGVAQDNLFSKIQCITEHRLYKNLKFSTFLLCWNSIVYFDIISLNHWVICRQATIEVKKQRRRQRSQVAWPWHWPSEQYYLAQSFPCPTFYPHGVVSVCALHSLYH